MKTIKQLRHSLDPKLFTSSLPKSLSYLVMDLLIIGVNSYLILLTLEIYFWLSIPFIVLQGRTFWSLFVVGHDCGHGSFSRYSIINNLIGFCLHQVLLVPFWAWKKSHQKHHQFHANLDKDESHVPIARHKLGDLLLSKGYKLGVHLNAILYITGLIFPIYLVLGHYYNNQRIISHFWLNSSFLKARDSKPVLLGTSVWLASLVLVALATYNYPTEALCLYVLPLLFCYHFLVRTTFLQHHYEDSKWYYNCDWNFVEGAFSTADYTYPRGHRLLSFLEHHISSDHLVHHLFPGIPHYNLVRASQALVNSLECTERQTFRFSYLRYWKLLITMNYVDDKNENQTSYKIRTAD